MTPAASGSASLPLPRRPALHLECDFNDVADAFPAKRTTRFAGR